MSEIRDGIREKPASAWQPIATAPMDGRMAIVYRPLANLTQDEPVALKRLVGGHQGCWERTVPPGEEPFNPTDGSCHVTHWMPLPEPPSSHLADAHTNTPTPRSDQQ